MKGQVASILSSSPQCAESELAFCQRTSLARGPITVILQRSGTPSLFRSWLHPTGIRHSSSSSRWLQCPAGERLCFAQSQQIGADQAYCGCFNVVLALVVMLTGILSTISFFKDLQRDLGGTLFVRLHRLRPCCWCVRISRQRTKFAGNLGAMGAVGRAVPVGFCSTWFQPCNRRQHDDGILHDMVAVVMLKTADSASSLGGRPIPRGPSVLTIKGRPFAPAYAVCSLSRF